MHAIAPTTPGTYYITAAFRAQFSAAQVMSSTNWTVGTLFWNDGDDVADWGASLISKANTNGNVQTYVRVSSGPALYYVPATAVAIVVASPPSTCVRDAATLCLSNNRFAVRTTWRTTTTRAGRDRQSRSPMTPATWYWSSLTLKV